MRLNDKRFRVGKWDAVGDQRVRLWKKVCFFARVSFIHDTDAAGQASILVCGSSIRVR